MRRILFVLTVICALMPAHMANAAARPWIEAGGSWSTYQMKDVNSDIENINTSTGLNMEHINSGFGMDAGLGFDLPPNVSLLLGYTRLFGSSEVGDASGSLKYDLPANAFRASAQYAFNGVDANGLLVGGSAGIVSSAGSVSLSSGGGSVSSSIDGSGPLLEGFVGGNQQFSPTWGLTGTVGYRYAKIGEVKSGGNIVYLPNGQKETVDYSGIFLRAALKLYLTR